MLGGPKAMVPAAVRLQCAFRCFTKRRAFVSMYRKAGHCLTAVARRYLEERDYRKVIVAALILQFGCRRSVEMFFESMLQEKKKAALTLSCISRRYIANWLRYGCLAVVSRPLQCMKTANTIIIASCLRCLARRQWHVHRNGGRFLSTASRRSLKRTGWIFQTQSATFLSAQVKCLKFHDLYFSARLAALALASFLRMCSVYNIMLAKTSACTELGAASRRLLAKRQLEYRRLCSTTLMSIFRRQLVVRGFDQKFHLNAKVEAEL